MRYLAPIILILSSLLLGPESARAQGERKIKIEKVLLGFHTGPETTRFKASAWAPVYVYLTNEGTARINTGEYILVVETTDSEDVQNHYTERRMLPPLNPGESTNPPLLAYARPGGEYNEVTVFVQTPEGRTLDSKKPAPEDSESVPFNAQFVLLAGSKLPGMKRGLIHPPGEDKPKEMVREGEPEEDNTLDSKGPLRFVSADSVDQLPARWFGYTGLDLIVLTTGREEFIKSLIEDQTGRKEALAEWVRRGGRLVISAGRNQQFVKDLLARTQLLKCELTGVASRPVLQGVSTWAGTASKFEGSIHKDKPGIHSDVEFTQLVPEAGVDVLARDLPGGRDKERPVIVQGSCGLGRVVLVAFDLDAPPFTSWQGQDAFWKKLAGELDIREVTQKDAGNPPPAMKGGRGQPQQPQNLPVRNAEQGELANRLQTSLETFDDVPVISFGWVALFILIYIIIVGPIDYFFLKKIVKRLELTWITFPVVVLGISAIAYFTAYWLKGNDLKINKVDVVDIDLASSRAYGSTWVTLYSPRIQNYTVGVEPAPANWNWALTKAEQPGDNTAFVDWMGRTESDWERRGQQGLLSWNRPTYRYADDAAGLEGVPIRVWATKSFTATWKTSLLEAKPIFEAVLHRVGNATDELEGTITSNLPVDLENVSLFYKGQLYALPAAGRLSPGEAYSINGLRLGKDRGTDIPRWFSEAVTSTKKPVAGSGSRVPKNQNAQSQPVGAFIKSVLFHSLNSTSSTEGNSLLRYLDQSWRLKDGDTHKEEVILFGHMAPAEGKAEDVTKKEISASRLWLGSLPDSGKPRKDLDGTLSQETYVRVYIPLTNR